MFLSWFLGKKLVKSSLHWIEMSGWNVHDHSILFPSISFQTSEIFLLRGLTAVARFDVLVAPSLATRMPNIWSCKPSGVTMKFSNVTCTSKNHPACFKITWQDAVKCRKNQGSSDEDQSHVSYTFNIWPERRSPASSEDLATSWWWKGGTLHCTPRWSLPGGSWRRVDLVWWNGFWSTIVFRQKKLGTSNHFKTI